jgi:hypothetical protein
LKFINIKSENIKTGIIRGREMRLILVSFIFLLLCPFQGFAGGEAESGRGQAIDDVSEGQLLPVGAIDPANYLEDFAFEKSNNSNQPLEFHVDLLKDSIWEKGEAVSMRISLITNNDRYFKTVPGNYIFYVQNPELLKQDIIKNWFRNKLQEYSDIEFLFFDPVNEKFLKIRNKSDVLSVFKQCTASEAP